MHKSLWASGGTFGSCSPGEISVERVHRDLLIVRRCLTLFQALDEPRGKLGKTSGGLIAGPQLWAIPRELQRIGSGQDVEPGITARKSIRRDRRRGGGGLALSVAPAVLKAVLQALQNVLSRQPSVTKVLIQTKGGQVSFEFDPKRISLQELVSAAERLGAAAPPA